MALDEVSCILHFIDYEGFSNALYTQVLEAQLILTKALNYQIWREKARDQNVINGDHNTSYFHRVAKFRAAAKPITRLYDGDIVITEPIDIEVHVFNYFTSIFSVDNNCVQNDMLDRCVPCLVSDEDSHNLLRLPLRNEIKDAVFDLNEDGAPGPDDFGGHFYHTYWDIIEADVIQSVQEFFITAALRPNINYNMLVLLPKVKGS